MSDVKKVSKKMVTITQKQFDVLVAILELIDAKKKATQLNISKKMKKNFSAIGFMCYKLRKSGLINSTHSDGFILPKKDLRFNVITEEVQVVNITSKKHE